MNVSDFEFDLPEELIARYPAAERTGSRLLHLDARRGQISHHQFPDLLQFIDPADLLVFNNTKVIPARLFGRKSTGGRVEVLLERITGMHEAVAQVRASKSPGHGSEISLDGAEVTLKVLEKTGGFYRLSFPSPGVSEIARVHGHMPLPPYIDRADEALDQDRYQTVYASKEGAVAAPTAGLHFDDSLLQQLDVMGVRREELTLHVGAGTFQPVRAARVEDHVMHAEFIDVPQSTCDAVSACRRRDGRVVAVGTTSVRSLETAGKDGSLQPFSGDTDIFIYPGYEFQVVDAMLTNFHLPGSTLMMLVSAFAGIENIRRAYQQAIDASYRFFSYGDAMLITR